MSGQNRYTSNSRSVPGSLQGELTDIILASFDSSEAMQKFVREQLGFCVLHQVNWQQALRFAAGDLFDHYRRTSDYAKLLEAVQKTQPDNKALAAKIDYLVEAGYLIDSQAATPLPSLNPRNMDWTKRYYVDKMGLRPEDRVVVIAAIAKCFTSVATIERFVGENFNTDVGASVRQNIDRNASVATVVEKAFNDFHERSLMNAFVFAVQMINQSDMMLGLVVAHFTPLHRIRTAAEYGIPTPPAAPAAAPETASAAAETAPAPAPVTANATPAPTTPAPAQSAPKAFKVVAAKAKLNADQLTALSKLITSCFDHFNLEMVCLTATGEQMDHIVEKGPLRKVCSDLLRYCEDEDKIPALLNDVLNRRPGRAAELKAHFEKLAAEGVLEIEK